MAAAFRMYAKCDVPAEYLVPPTPQMLDMAAFELEVDPDEVAFHPVLLVPSCGTAKSYWIWHHSQPLHLQMNSCIVSMVSLKIFAERIGLVGDDAGAMAAEDLWVKQLKEHGCPQNFFLMSFRKADVAELYREGNP